SRGVAPAGWCWARPSPWRPSPCATGPRAGSWCSCRRTAGSTSSSGTTRVTTTWWRCRRARACRPPSPPPRRPAAWAPRAPSRFFVARVVAYAGTDPLGFAALQPKKVRLLLGGDEILRNQAIYPVRADSPVLRLLLWKIPGLAFPFGLLLPPAVLGLVVGA